MNVKPQLPNLLFGQFLIDKKVITSEILMSALKKQVQEKSTVMSKSERFLGQILIEDFKIFDRLILTKLLKEFNVYKIEIENEFYDLKRLNKA
jgi:hypothetical protein